MKYLLNKLRELSLVALIAHICSCQRKVRYPTCTTVCFSFPYIVRNHETLQNLSISQTLVVCSLNGDSTLPSRRYTSYSKQRNLCRGHMKRRIYAQDLWCLCFPFPLFIQPEFGSHSPSLDCSKSLIPEKKKKLMFAGWDSRFDGDVIDQHTPQNWNTMMMGDDQTR